MPDHPSPFTSGVRREDGGQDVPQRDERDVDRHQRHAMRHIVRPTTRAR